MRPEVKHDEEGFRVTPYATEYRRPNGSCVQMQGHGDDVRARLKGVGR